MARNGQVTPVYVKDLDGRTRRGRIMVSRLPFKSTAPDADLARRAVESLRESMLTLAANIRQRCRQLGRPLYLPDVVTEIESGAITAVHFETMLVICVRLHIDGLGELLKPGAFDGPAESLN